MTEQLTTTAGAGLSDVGRDPANWRRRDYPVSRSWVHQLDELMLEEIDTALKTVKDSGITCSALTPADFPVPRVAKLMANLQQQLDRGIGFCVLGGLPVDRYSYADNQIIYCGISSHLGVIVPQTGNGDHIIDVTDIGKPYDHQSRGYSSNKLLPFHTDGADIAGLLCLGVSARGGASILVSAPQVFERLTQSHPRQLEVLQRGFYHHRRGEQPDGDSPVSDQRIPVFQFHDGLLHTMYNRNPIEWARHEGIELTASEIDALDTLDAVMALPELQLTMEMRKGDMQFINNFVILHSRTEYEDSVDSRRHLVRLWMNLTTGQRRGHTLLDLYAPQAAKKNNTVERRHH